MNKDQIGDQSLVYIELALVLGAIPNLVTLRQDAPHFRTEAERVRKHLKDDVSILGPIALTPQRSEAQCMSGAIAEVEATFQGQVSPLRVSESHATRMNQPCVLLCVECLHAQGFSWTGQPLKR